jgi:DNA topoisomerase-2
MASLTDKYQKKTDREHVLDNPDTYTGSMEPTDYETYVYDAGTNRIIHKNISIIPGLYKLFDEGVVNCRDHYVRQQQSIQNEIPNTLPVTKIDIEILEDGTIIMMNDGNGIDIEKHPEHGLWIPEMIFGHLRTSTNYDKTQKKIVGGKNGFGFKLALIWSTIGSVETVDHIRKLKYIQEFTDNLTVIHPPKITKASCKPYTRITFRPDYKRLNCSSGLDENMIALFRRRVYDIAAVTNKTVKVIFNKEVVNTKTFEQYIDMYVGPKAESPRVYEITGPRWEYVVCLTKTGEFSQVSFVNGIFTNKGGKHVDYISGQIVKKLIAYIQTKRKITVQPSSIKEQLMIFVNCDIDNPVFDSQTKDYLSTPVSKFGSSCDVSDKVIDKIAKMGVMSAACDITHVKETKTMKKTDGSKNRTIRGISKLVDANDAGTSKSSECVLCIVEGDSAKAGAVSGLSKESRRTIGVYPLKGKLMNVRGERSSKIGENKEIVELKQIIGLESGKVYTSETVKQKLRYGKIIFLTDQDLDGTHIKALCVNMFQCEWGSLLDIDGFIGFMNTPILKARKGKSELAFYNDGEYEEWKRLTDTTGWNMKFYKGLGTSTAKEFKEYFADKKIVSFESTGTECMDRIDMLFNKKRSNDRKTWLGTYNRSHYMDTNKDKVTYSEFINREMIHFSKYDCDRSIPNVVDGLKISQRKVLYASFKRRLTSEVKVAQFSGYVSEHSAYHHGEQSLNGTIVNLAQNFTGSNNINLFDPLGQFGTRLQGGSDSASERYIFTKLNPITRYIYREEDDVVLDYLCDDGMSVEPVWYAPIIPMILVNGSMGIGTGFSTDIPSFNPRDIIRYIKYKLSDDKDSTSPEISMYYRGFKGTIERVSDKYVVKGEYSVSGNTVHVTELPVGTWTDPYKEHLEKLIQGDGKKKGSSVKEYIDMSTDVNVDIKITMTPGTIDEYNSKRDDNNVSGLEKLLKLYTTKTITNMHAFDHDEKLVKYDSPEDMVDSYIPVRLGVYEKRKNTLLINMKNELRRLSNKARFITSILDDTIDLRRKTSQEIKIILTSMKYDLMESDPNYNYLIKMPMDSLTTENVDKLLETKRKLELDIKDLEGKSCRDIWIHELGELMEKYDTINSTTKLKKKLKTSS